MFKSMNDKLAIAIETLVDNVKAKEKEVNDLKKVINKLCGDAGIAVRFTSIQDSETASGGIRSDEYYGQPLTAAIRNYLERRKASGLGAATVVEIYRAIKEGGFKFETASDLNARIGVGNTLRKTSSIFHRLPNGQYGLLAWYPGAKEKTDAEPPREREQTGKSAKKSKSESVEPAKPDRPNVTNHDVREVVLAQTGNFKTADIVVAVKAKFPQKELPATKIPSGLFELKKKGLIKEISPRAGSTPAVYAKT